MRPSLGDLALFRDFEHGDVLLLAEMGEEIAVPSGEVVIREGGQHDSLFIVLAGKFLVTRSGVTLAEISVGQICGEMEMLNPPHSMATVTAARDAVIWQITREGLRTFLSEHPQTGNRLMKLLAQTFAARLAE